MNERKLSRLFPNASKSFQRANIDDDQGQGTTAKLECAPSNEPLAENQVKERNTRKCEVSVMSVRKRLIDTDNLSPKYMVDALRYSGSLHCDSPDKTTITTTQRKCEEGEEEFVEITITYL